MLPPPTFPVTWERSVQLPDAWSGGICRLDEEDIAVLWHAVRPQWASSDQALFAEDLGWDALARFLADRNGWSASLAAEAAVALRPHSVLLRYSLTRGDALAISGSEPIQPGFPAVFGSAQSRSVILDFDVEIAQQTAIADPIGGLQYAGLSMATYLLPVPGVGWEAEVVITGARFLENVSLNLGCNEMSGMARNPSEIYEFQATTLLQPGLPVDLHLPGWDGDLVLRLEADARVPASTTRVGSVQVVVAPGLRTSGALAGAVENLQGHGDTWHTSSGILAFGGSSADALAAQAVAMAAQASHSLTTGLSFRLTHRDEYSSQAAAVRGPLLADRPVRFAHGILALSIRDWDVEVAQAARIPDPRMDFLYRGYRGSFLPEEKAVQLDLDFRFDDLGEPLVLRLADSVAILQVEGDGGSTMPVVRASVDQVLSDRMGLHGYFPLSSDGSLVLERQSRHALRVEVHCGEK